jgi:exopolysaccharide biosynthesis polyprenyl glycosylphosphotransferase
VDHGEARTLESDCPETAAVSALEEATTLGLDLDTLALDEQTESILEWRDISSTAQRNVHAHRRGWLVRRALLGADVTSLVLAFVLAKLIVSGGPGHQPGLEFVVLALMLPVWVVAAKLYGLYERDEEHVDHSTVDEVVRVFHLVTLGAWCYFVTAWTAGVGNPHVARLVTFWLLAAVLVVAGRGVARAAARRSPMYLQNTLIIGAGDIGQLAGRKLLQHPEYKINLVGFVDAHPRPRRPELDHLALLGPPEQIGEIVEVFDIERVIIAFSESDHEELLKMIRELRKVDLQIDVVPRLFEIVGPKAGIHTLEGLSLVGLAPARISPSSRLLKRAVDYAVAIPMLVLLAPLMLLIALAIRLDSPGPALFRQRRLGRDMRPFTVLKFRTMRVDTDQEEHRRYIESIATHQASPNGNGLYKLDRSDAVTRVGRFLRETSLDELPQLLNVVAGEMSLVGPRPCLEYETEEFADHHYERFLMPPGLTGLWQVTARAKSTFVEALDMDVEYVRGWSLGLDLQLLLKTPFSLFRMRATA